MEISDFYRKLSLCPNDFFPVEYPLTVFKLSIFKPYNALLTLLLRSDKFCTEFARPQGCQLVTLF